MKTLRAPVLRRPGSNTNGSNGTPPPRAFRPAVRRADTITTVTLLRGRVYCFYNVMFEVGVETAIDNDLIKRNNIPRTPEELAEEISDLFEEVVDSDGDDFSKPIFEVRHNRPRPVSVEEQKRTEKPRRIRQYIEVPNKPGPGRPRMVGVRPNR